MSINSPTSRPAAVDLDEALDPAALDNIRAADIDGSTGLLVRCIEAFEASSFAEAMTAFLQSDVDIQTMSGWEEFHGIPSPRGFPPWGMITQQGSKKPMYHVHGLFDRLSRGASAHRRPPGRCQSFCRGDQGQKHNPTFRASSRDCSDNTQKLFEVVRNQPEAGSASNPSRPARAPLPSGPQLL